MISVVVQHPFAIHSLVRVYKHGFPDYTHDKLHFWLFSNKESQEDGHGKVIEKTLPEKGW